MSTEDDLTLRILAEIRRDGRTTRDELRNELRATNLRIDHLERRVEDKTQTLGRQITESEARTATAINELTGTLHAVHGMLRNRLGLQDRVSRCERDIGEIKQRMG